MAKRSGSAKSCGGKKVKVECSPVCGVSDISADPHATVHGIVVSVSLKRKAGHFEGELNDGVAVVRVVGFEEKQREILLSHVGQMVVLRNCQTQVSTYSNQMEVLLKSFSKIEQSNAEVDIKDITTIGADVICLKQLQDKEDCDRVIVRVKVVKVREEETVGDGKRKQDVEVADESDIGNVVLWEGDVGKLEDSVSYQLNRFKVRSFKGKNFLSMPPCGGSIQMIEDIGAVAQGDANDNNDVEMLVAARVMGVHQFESFYSCLFCKKGIIEKHDGSCGECNLCKTMQVLQVEKLTAKLCIVSDGKRVSVRVYSNELSEIVNGKKVTPAELLFAAPFNIKYNEFHVAVEISRPG